MDEWAQAMRLLFPGSELSPPDRRAFEALDSAAGVSPGPHPAVTTPEPGRAVDQDRLPPLGADLDELSPAALGIVPEVVERVRRITLLCGLPFAAVARDPGLSLMPEYGLPGTVAFSFHPSRRLDDVTGSLEGELGPAMPLWEALVGGMGLRLLPALLRAGGLDVRPGWSGGEELIWGLARPLPLPPALPQPLPAGATALTAGPGPGPRLDPLVTARVRQLARLCTLPFAEEPDGVGIRLAPATGHTGRTTVGYLAPRPLRDAAAVDPGGAAAALLEVLEETTDELLLTLLTAAGLDVRRERETLELVVHGIAGPPPLGP
ncbi:hypothetical protein AB0K43_30370 [Kitasatospora sp. NPDC049258]|uniref:hypothetical protein n=1 Tax=Kitasatospora sp. NPDC049258 TaxID=3155394 RepID=UPI00342F053A